jgi:radical SAM protein with 4Fe4S-binding SPASM domain
MHFDSARLTQLQRDNLSQAIEAYDIKALQSSPSPPVLFLELTKNCNAVCGFCRASTWKNDPCHSMSQSTLEQVFQDYVPYASLVDLRGWGESLLLPHLDEIVERVARAGPRLRITTTLSCGTRKALQSFIDHDVFVSVSLDTGEAETYEKLRPGARFGVVMKNLKFLAEGFQERYGTTVDRLRISVAPLQRSNLDHLPGIVDIAQAVGVKEIRILPLEAAPWDRNRLGFVQAQTRQALTDLLKRCRAAGIRVQLGAAPFRGLRIGSRVFDRCCHPWMYAVVDAHGHVGSCDHMIGPGLPTVHLGNLSQERAQVWNGPVAQAERGRHNRGRFLGHNLTCARCYYGGRYADHEHEVNPKFSRWLVTQAELEPLLVP